MHRYDPRRLQLSFLISFPAIAILAMFWVEVRSLHQARATFVKSRNSTYFCFVPCLDSLKTSRSMKCNSIEPGRITQHKIKSLHQAVPKDSLLIILAFRTGHRGIAVFINHYCNSHSQNNVRCSHHRHSKHNLAVSIFVTIHSKHH